MTLVDGIWVTKTQSRSNVYIGELDGMVFIISKCCDAKIEPVYRARGYDYTCLGCSNVIPVPAVANGTASGFRIKKWTHNPDVLKDWTSQWCDIPRENINIEVIF